MLLFQELNFLMNSTMTSNEQCRYPFSFNKCKNRIPSWNIMMSVSVLLKLAPVHHSSVDSSCFFSPLLNANLKFEKWKSRKFMEKEQQRNQQDHFVFRVDILSFSTKYNSYAIFSLFCSVSLLEIRFERFIFLWINLP